MNNYKAVVRIPTNQYAYMEMEVEGTLEDIVNAHNALEKQYKGFPVGSGLTDAEWRVTLDRYLFGDETMESETYIAMNERQQFVIQEIKKARKRQEYENTKGNLHHSLT